MSTNEIKSKRYPGLVEQARGLHGDLEVKGWRLAEVIHEMITELYNEGYTISDHGNSERMTAVRRVGQDVELSAGTVQVYYRMWRKFSDPSTRDPIMTFNDHYMITKTPKVAPEIRRRAQGRGNAKRGQKRSAPVPAVDPIYPYSRLTNARSHLRKAIEANLSDYPDGDKALAYMTDIQQLATEMLIKFSGQKVAQETRPAVRVAA